MWIAVAVLLILLLWGLWAFQLVLLPTISNTLGVEWQWSLTESGPWGDTFGALNTLFASFGFIAVLVTIRQQQKQIKSVQDDQHRQRFESSYFELLSLFREARKELTFVHTNEYYNAHPGASRNRREGVGALRAAWNEVVYHAGLSEGDPSKMQVADVYRRYVHTRHESSLGPYFRLLYTILHRIKTDPVLTNEEKYKYSNLLRSQLSSYELPVMALNGLSPVSKDFDELIIEFRMLKYVPDGRRRKILGKYYPKEAFAPRD